MACFTAKENTTISACVFLSILNMMFSSWRTMRWVIPNMQGRMKSSPQVYLSTIWRPNSTSTFVTALTVRWIKRLDTAPTGRYSLFTRLPDPFTLLSSTSSLPYRSLPQATTVRCQWQTNSAKPSRLSSAKSGGEESYGHKHCLKDSCYWDGASQEQSFPIEIAGS